MPRIAAVSSSRADWAHLRWPLRAMRAHPDVEPLLFVTGAHLDTSFGHTVDVIEREGYAIEGRVPCLAEGDSDFAMARGIGRGTLGFAEVLGAARPDAVLIIADRYEMLAPAAAAMALRIPIVHIEGGERSEGAIDQQVRDALTKMAHVHLATSELARRTIVAMGEAPWRVHRVGAASLDQLEHEPPLSPAAIDAALGFTPPGGLVVAAFHPVTLDPDPADEAGAFFAALERIEAPLVLCHPNADAGHRTILERATRFCDARADAHLLVNLDPATYIAVLRSATLMLGNSSSGVMESTSLELPAVDVGRRQQGREHAANVLRVPADADAIVAAVDRARTDEFRASCRGLVNPYGDGNAGTRIAEILADLPDRATLLEKRAVS